MRRKRTFALGPLYAAERALAANRQLLPSQREESHSTLRVSEVSCATSTGHPASTTGTRRKRIGNSRSAEAATRSAQSRTIQGPDARRRGLSLAKLVPCGTATCSF